jgi:hypothetical protein
MTSISQMIYRSFLTTFALCSFFVGVVACPGTKLTISFSWPVSSQVHIVNSGVPTAAVNAGISAGMR